MTDELSAPASDAEWRAYHAIRRRVLFELRGRTGYDPHHPDEHRPGNHPLVLRHDGTVVGVIRVDVGGGVATFRRVAIRDDMQRLGLGRQLLARAEAFALTHGCRRVDSHVAPDAVGFYERCGYRPVGGAARSSSAVLMTKPLARDSPG